MTDKPKIENVSATAAQEEEPGTPKRVCNPDYPCIPDGGCDPWNDCPPNSCPPDKNCSPCYPDECEPCKPNQCWPVCYPNGSKKESK